MISRCGTWPSPVNTSTEGHLKMKHDSVDPADKRTRVFNVSLTAGSRDSLSLCLDGSAPVVGSEPRLLGVIDRLLLCWTRPCVPRRASTQVLEGKHRVPIVD